MLVLDDGRVAQAGHAPGGRRPARAPTTSPGWSGSTCSASRATAAARSAPTRVTVCLDRARRDRARHRGRAAVAERAQHGDAVRLLVSAATADLIADVTPQAAAELGLAPGREVWLSVKATAVTLRTRPARP